MQARIYMAHTAQTIHPSNRFFDEIRFVLHAYCRDVYAKYMSGNQEAVKGYFTAT